MSNKTEKVIEKAERVIEVLESVIYDLENNDFKFTRTKSHPSADRDFTAIVIESNPMTDAEMNSLFAL